MWDYSRFYLQASMSQGSVLRALKARGDVMKSDDEVDLFSLTSVNSDSLEGVCLALSVLWCTKYSIPDRRPKNGMDAIDYMTDDGTLQYAATLQRIYTQVLAMAVIKRVKDTYKPVFDSFVEEVDGLKAATTRYHPRTTSFHPPTILYTTQPLNYPFVVVYKFQNSRGKECGHAIACMRDGKLTHLFDPNAGQFTCFDAQREDMWNAYWTDIALMGWSLHHCGAFLLEGESVAPRKKKLCFLATAACDTLWLPDNCEQLETLRWFRDKYVLTSSEGRQRVEEYYNIAPEVVEIIKQRSDAKEIFSEIYGRWVRPAVNAIQLGHHHQAHAIFEEVVTESRKRFLPNAKASKLELFS